MHSTIPVLSVRVSSSLRQIFPNALSPEKFALAGVNFSSRSRSVVMRRFLHATATCALRAQPIPIYFPVEMASEDGDPRKGDEHKICYEKPIPVVRACRTASERDNRSAYPGFLFWSLSLVLPLIDVQEEK